MPLDEVSNHHLYGSLKMNTTVAIAVRNTMLGCHLNLPSPVRAGRLRLAYVLHVNKQYVEIIPSYLRGSEIASVVSN